MKIKVKKRMITKKELLYFIISMLLLVGSVLCGIFVFKNSYLRFYEAIKDFGLSFVYYIQMIFNVEWVSPTVNSYSSVMALPRIISNWESVIVYFCSYFSLLVTKSNMVYFLTYSRIVIVNTGKVILILIPVVFIFSLTYKTLLFSENIKSGKTTLALKFWKILEDKIFMPVYNFIVSFLQYFKKHSWQYKLMIIVWIFNFNISSIIAGFFAFYFYFCITFSFKSLLIHVVKLAADLYYIARIPIFLYVIVGVLVFHYMRKKIALRRLRHMEAMNCGFIKSLPIVTMGCGAMGTGKTKLTTDMSLSQAVMFRQEALDMILKFDFQFPKFPWVKFEKHLNELIEKREIYNLGTVQRYFEKIMETVAAGEEIGKYLFDYDYKKYGLIYYDELKPIYILDTLSNYAKVYLIYIVQSSLIVSNYSIREDNSILSKGNFPMWAHDFFDSDLDSYFKKTGHSHILDFDVLRLGKKLVENNPFAGSFEFGVLIFTEIGKERGNMLDNIEVKISDDESNVKNDMFNSYIKLCRHSSTIDNYPFIKVFMDEQRPMSLGADFRELCDVVTIVDVSEHNLTLPFYTIEEIIFEKMESWFKELYVEYKFNSGSTSLPMYLVKSFITCLLRFHYRNSNHYGYKVLTLSRESGKLDGVKTNHPYFLMDKKCHSDRYSTDCYSEYFVDKAMQAKKGLDDYPVYAATKATVPELLSQNSYFMTKLYSERSSITVPQAKNTYSVETLDTALPLVTKNGYKICPNKKCGSILKGNAIATCPYCGQLIAADTENSAETQEK